MLVRDRYYPRRNVGWLPWRKRRRSKKAIAICHEHDVVPALSCGMNPDAAARIQSEIGNDWMVIGEFLHSGESIKKQTKKNVGLLWLEI